MIRFKPTCRHTLILVALMFFLAGSPISARDFDRDTIDSGMERAVHKMMLAGQVPSAAVALVAGDKVIWEGAYGNTNLWSRTPAVPTSVYLIGSTFKTMAMTALLQQMELGKFKLDDPVNNYLTEFKIRGEDSGIPVTFRHLLAHVSGLPGDFGPHPVWGGTVPAPLKDYLKKKLKLSHPTMSKPVYSNLAYSLVAYLVESFSGMPFKKYIKENIFEPLEMNDTDFYPRGNMEERLSIPYVYDAKQSAWKPAVRVKADVWPAGIVYGTVLNQANWLICNLNRGVFRGKRLISEDTFQQIMTRQYEAFAGPIGGGWLNSGTGFGFTWWISQRKGDTLFAHSGSVSGYTAFMVGNLDKRTGFVVLTNGNRAHKHLFALAISALDLIEEGRQ